MNAPAQPRTRAPADLLRVADLSLGELKHLLGLAKVVKKDARPAGSEPTAGGG